LVRTTRSALFPYTTLFRSETAEGAALVTNEYKKLVRAGTMPNIITTCCPSVNDLIEKYYPDCAALMAPVVSPMIAHGRYIKRIRSEEHTSELQSRFDLVCC